MKVGGGKCWDCEEGAPGFEEPRDAIFLIAVLLTGSFIAVKVEAKKRPCVTLSSNESEY